MPPAAAPFGAHPPSRVERMARLVLASPRLSTATRARLRRACRGHAPRGPVDVTVEGLRLRLCPADNKTDFDIFAKGRLDEAAERAFLAERLGAGEIFVDIGANIGIYTLSVLAKGPPGASAVAFEPHPAMRTRLAFNLAANGFAGRVTLIGEAVGPSAATMRLITPSANNAGRSSLVASGDAPGTDVEVPVRPLASLLEAPGRARIDAIKIDVEGFEDQALMPFFDTAPPDAWPHSIVIETLHRALWRRDCLAELVSLGYEEVERTDENALLARHAG